MFTSAETVILFVLVIFMLGAMGATAVRSMARRTRPRERVGADDDQAGASDQAGKSPETEPSAEPVEPGEPADTRR